MIPVVVGSSPISHPIFPRRFPKALFRASVFRLSAEIPVVEEKNDARKEEGRDEKDPIPPVGVVHDATLLSITVFNVVIRIERRIGNEFP